MAESDPPPDQSTASSPSVTLQVPEATAPPRTVPAAGPGTRTGPRPIPKSSSSLRHVTSKGRTLSFHTPLHEDRDLSDLNFAPGSAGEGSSVQRQVDLHKRRTDRALEQEDFLGDASEESEGELGEDAGNMDVDRSAPSRPPTTGWGLDSDSDEQSSDASSAEDHFSSLRSNGGASWSNAYEDDHHRHDGDDDIEEEEEDGEDMDALGEEGPALAKLDPSIAHRVRRHARATKMAGEDAAAAESRYNRYAAKEPGGPSLQGPKRAPWHPHYKAATNSAQDIDSPPLAGPSSRTSYGAGAATPGPRFAVGGLHTPLEVSPPTFNAAPAVEPRQRLEWQTMLHSVLNSEVLRSETKRITSVDAVVLTREELMYKRWLDIRASLRGRGNVPGAANAEEKRLTEGWAILVRDTIIAIKEYRPGPSTSTDKKPDANGSEKTGVNGEPLPPPQDVQTKDELEAESSASLEEVGKLLARVHSAEEQFPSTRKLLEIVPEWGEPALQAKLAALYSWYNVTSSLQLQMSILQRWTGSEALEITSYERTYEKKKSAGDAGDAEPEAEPEESTFVERILKEGSLQSTFEKRTLSALTQLIQKAKQTIITHHEAFAQMALPSFEPELVKLISFPTRLMEGALKLRLDYAGKLREPSVLIIDSLTDDLRAALALACRIKLGYSTTMVPDPANGWDLPPCIGSGYDAVLRDALRFFFRLLNFKLKGSVFFKETEILEPEWLFLSTAVEVIDGGDIIVARSVTKIVNKLFARIVTYFERELSAPSTSRTHGGSSSADGERGPASVPNGAGSDGTSRAPSTAGGLTRGKVRMSLEEKAKWIHAVFDNVRIRSRKLLGFARDIRNRLDNAAEYDLSTLAAPPTNEEDVDANGVPHIRPLRSDGKPMDLNAFMQTLINANYFLVFTQSFEEEGIFVIAEPTLDDKPELIQELLTKCLRRTHLSDADRPPSVSEATTAVFANGEVGVSLEAASLSQEDEDAAPKKLKDQSLRKDDPDEQPHYLLLVSPCDLFLWTGRVMTHSLPNINVDLKERRVRLVADGPKGRLQKCKDHFHSIFADSAQVLDADETSANNDRAGSASAALPGDPEGYNFPLEIVHEHMAHMSVVQHELKLINKGVYMLSDSIIRSVPKIRRNMRGRRSSATSRLSHDAAARQRAGDKSGGATKWRGGTGGDCDELIQNCFSMAAEQAFRSLPFIESTRLQGQMTLALAGLAIDWVAFICDDCVPTDRKTFKWAVAALENANNVTRAESIFQLDENDFRLLRTKVASCMALLISHFDIMGARSSVASAKAQQEQLERERAEKERVKGVTAIAPFADTSTSSDINAGDGSGVGLNEAERKATAAKMVAGTGAGAPPMFGRTDSGMQATEERWVQKVLEWEAARQSIETEQRLIGRVLDETRLEDRGLQFLASSSSRIQIRWQQGRFIGGGAFGTVYLAVNLDSGGLMAVKEIRFQDISSTPGVYKQIKDEMNVMEMLSHPNIVEYYGIEVHRDKVYIFEEYCQGGSLADLLGLGRIEDEAVSQVYTLQMLDGLVYLHSRGVVHRDIKPENILLDHMGVIKFVDFGASKILAKNQRTVQRSRRATGGGGADGKMGGMLAMLGPDGKPTGAGGGQSLQGTPMYMSPEVIKGDTRGRRGAMDVWSLGCIVLEFATGRRPWSQLDNPWAIMFHIGMAQQHPPLPEPGQLSEQGIDFIRQCLVIDPYERPSAAEMREHPWIQSLVEELNAANAMGDADGANLAEGVVPVTPFVDPNDGAAGVAAMAATPSARQLNGFNFGPMTPASFEGNMTPSAWSDSTGGSAWPQQFPAGAVRASMPVHLEAQTPSATSSFRPPLPNSTATVPLTTPVSSSSPPSTATLAGASAAAVSHAAPITARDAPLHPSRVHPGSEAVYADMQYARERGEIRRMLEATPHGSELSSPGLSEMESGPLEET